MLKVHFTRFSERTKEGGIFSYQTDEKDNVRERGGSDEKIEIKLCNSFSMWGDIHRTFTANS
jgi:hypothetical protein